MDSPQAHIWGPQLWMILHSAAERIGLPQHKKLPQEETRIWTQLLASLRYSLPCPACKQHYNIYFQANPIFSLTREFIRNWIYTLHTQVNLKTDKPNTITIEQIPEIYSKPFNFSFHMGIVTQEIYKALRIGWITRDDAQRSFRLFEELKRFYDFF